MSRFNCSIVGLGRIGSSLEDDPLREKPATHAGAIALNPDCILLSGCDIDPLKRRVFEERWGCTHVFETIDELFAYKKPDILHVATPPYSHVYYIEKAISNAIPLVICEKPLSENVREAKRIAKKALCSRTTLMVNHERRYSADYIRVKQIIAEGQYGKLLAINALLCMGYKRTVREMLYEDGTHLADIIRYLVNGEIGSIRAFGDPDEKSGALAIYGLSQGIPILIEAACNRDHLIFELSLGFEKGKVTIGNGIFEIYESIPSMYYKGFNSLAKKVDILYATTGYFSGMLEDAVRILASKDSGRTPVSRGIDGYKAIEVIHTILKRCKANR
jgi:predicted dehydrogenase